MSDDIGGRAVPDAVLPDDTIRVPATDLKILLGPDGAGKLDIGLYVQLPVPLGPIRIHLDANQLVDLHRKLHTLLDLDIEQTSALLAQIYDAQPDMEG
ncbi:hypothetical protein [Mycolicibacterium vinylchloridicum]|uniref:hypothetical protein n=1 Tax=Mycolicibacterium vinylchloridicum TaxID=2736928 RepID=UPI0015C758A5|nr:hypothetical protein [Mycolicibacterium vinylchloridicum]